MGTKERIRKAFCNICSGRWAENPDGSGCGGHFEGISKDDICLVLTDPAWLARSARRFVKMEETDRLKRQQRIDAEIKREEELLETLNRTQVLIGYPVKVIWGEHSRRFHELGGCSPWPVAACGTGFAEPHWGTPDEARAKGLTPCKLICGHVIAGVDDGTLCQEVAAYLQNKVKGPRT